MGRGGSIPVKLQTFTPETLRHQIHSSKPPLTRAEEYFGEREGVRDVSGVKSSSENNENIINFFGSSWVSLFLAENAESYISKFILLNKFI